MLPFLSPTGTLRGQGALRRTLLSTTAGVSLPAATYSADFKTLSAMPAYLTHSRPSNATMMDSLGRRVYAPNNGISNTDIVAVSPWQKSNAPFVASGLTDSLGGTRGSTFDMRSSGSVFVGNFPTPLGVNLIFAVDVRLGSSGTSATRIRLTTNNTTAWNSGQSSAFTLTSSWQRIWIRGQFSDTNIANIGIDGRDETGAVDSTCLGTVDMALPHIAAITYETTPPAFIETSGSPYYGPRFGYEYRGGSWVRSGLVFEGEQRANLAPADINGAGWSTSDCALDQPGTTIAGKTAWRQRVDGGGGVPSDLTALGHTSELWFAVAPAASGNGQYPSCVSIDFKYDTHPYVGVHIEFGATSGHYATAVFDLSGTTDQDPTETFVSADGIVAYAKAKYRGNGEWRIYFVGVLTGPSASTNDVTPVFGFAPKRTGNEVSAWGEPRIPLDGSAYLPATAVGYWLDPMLEVGIDHCSQEFIPVNSTRASDKLNVVDPVAAAIFANPWSYAASFRIGMPSVNYFMDLLAMDDNLALANYLEFGAANYVNFGGTLDQLRPFVWSQASSVEGPVLHGPGFSDRIAIAEGGGTILLAANGVQSQTVSAGTGTDIFADNSSPIDIGSYASGPYEQFMGWIERVDFWNSKLSSSDLAGVSA